MRSISKTLGCRLRIQLFASDVSLGGVQMKTSTDTRVAHNRQLSAAIDF